MINFNSIALNEKKANSRQSVKQVIINYTQDNKQSFKAYKSSVFALKMNGAQMLVSNKKRLVQASKELPELIKALHNYLKQRYGANIELYRGLNFKNVNKGTMSGKLFSFAQQNKGIELSSFNKQSVFEWTDDKRVAEEFMLGSYNEHGDRIDQPYGIMLSSQIPVSLILYAYDPIGLILREDIDVQSNEHGYFVLHKSNVKAKAIKLKTRK